jgi:hypothetical protein
MARVRVTCAVPRPDCAPCGYPMINGIVPSMEDVHISVVRDDGTEETLQGVQAIRWEAKEGTENRLTLQLLDADVDIVADVEPEELVPARRIPGPYSGC